MLDVKKFHGLIDIKWKGKGISMFPIPTDRKYPETKEEFKRAMVASIEKISEEARYMIGCVFFAKAPILKPKSKAWWFEKLFHFSAPSSPMNDIALSLGVRQDQGE
jgi:hypothetical protein